jgi:hypothetical protein
MSDAWIVARGVDTLILNVFYLDEDLQEVRGVREKRKRDLHETLRKRLDAWKKDAVSLHDEVPTSLLFNNSTLHMQPNGAGRGQWPYLLKTPDITLYVSTGNWNGIASIRFSSQYLWSLPLIDVINAAQSFINDLFEQEMYLQLSQVDLCADVAGWSDIETLERGKHFISRMRKGRGYDESSQVYDLASSDYTFGLKRTGFDFGRDKKRVSPLSCRMYNKTLELEKSGKDWFLDLYYSRGWVEEDGPVWRVEFSFKREVLHELRQEIDGEEQFHGLEDVYDLPARLPLLWAYAAGQVDHADENGPDGWLRCVVPSSDTKRSRWPTHPVWRVVQGAFLEDIEAPPHFGKIIRKKWRHRNIEKGIEAVIGQLSSLAAWNEEGILAEGHIDLSIALHWLAEEGEKYLQRVGRDFSREVQRKRVKFGLQAKG